MPTWQGEEFLERVLASLAAQRVEVPWDMLVVDSGSTDATLAILERAREDFPVPLRVRGIHQLEFDHGDTRNLLAALSEGELLVFLTQDAIPSGADWLARLARNFEDPDVAAATCRNLPRPDAQLLTKLFSEQDMGYQAGRREVRLPDAETYAGLDPHARRLLYNFNDVASAVRRDVWERHPFPRTAFGEDILMARALLEAGYTVVYDDEATVEHSHDYDAREMRARAEIDGRFNAEWLDRTCVGSARDADTLTQRQLAADRAALVESGLEGRDLRAALDEARALREAAFHGLYEGGLSQRRRPATAMRERADVHVLFVLHGFPPDTWAGTEVVTLELARELQRRGQRVTILTRAPRVAGGPEDFHLQRTEFEGLEVWRLTHALEHTRLRDTFDQPRIDGLFRTLLAEVRPDVVHFQHLIHLSAGLVRVAREAGLPTIVHLHDYWGLCARVQLIRPDGERCERNMGAGCFLCIKERALDEIPRLARVDALARPMLDALAAGVRGTARLTGRSARRWEGFGDLRARQDFVLGALARADLLISPSRFLRQKLLETGALDPHTTLYSENGMRTDHVRALEKRPDPSGRLRVGFVGSLVWYKGGRVLIDAMARLAGRDVVLHVHGAFDPASDPHHAELQAAAGENVVFHGRFDNERLSEVYAEIDVLVVPSLWYENAPVTIREAFLTRTPVVASGIGGMAESVRDGVDGLHFAVGDAEDLARTLRRLLDEPGLLRELAADHAPVKTVAESAAELEFRYRALCCIARTRGDWVLLDVPGAATVAREGPVQEQGRDLLLLRPGGAAVEYDLTTPGAGACEVAVEVLALGAEPRVSLSGRVLLDGALLGAIEPFRAADGDEARRFRFQVEALRPGARLRVEARASATGPDTFLRVARVLLLEPGASVAEPQADGARPTTAEAHR